MSGWEIASITLSTISLFIAIMVLLCAGVKLARYEEKEEYHSEKEAEYRAKLKVLNQDLITCQKHIDYLERHTHIKKNKRRELSNIIAELAEYLQEVELSEKNKTQN